MELAIKPSLEDIRHHTIFLRLDVDKPSGDLIIDMPITVALNINLQKGIIKPTAGNNFAASLNTTITGGSDSAYVEGAMLRYGTSAFTYPVGGGGVYAPVTLDAVASNCTFKVEYFAQDPDSLYSRSAKDSTIGFVNRCGYWVFDRTFGTQNTTPTLGWSNNPCYSTAPVDASVAFWDGSTWKDKGNAAYSGTSTAGNVKGTAVITSYPTIVNLGGVCSFIPELTTNLDTLIDGYLGFVQASPENQLNYKFLNNGIEVQNGAQSYYSSSSFINADSVSVIVTNLDGCEGSASLTIVESANEPYTPATELVFDWASNDGAQEFFLNHKTLVKTDALGNVYKAGSTLNENGDYDILVCKYDSNGVNLWCEQYGGAANGMDVVGDIELDNNASLFVCGSSVEVAADSNDVIVLKYLSNGTLAWSAHFNGVGDGADAGVDISVNSSTSKVYVSGITTGTLAPLTDFLTMQLDTNGNILWNKVYDNGLFDVATGHTVTSGDTITVAGVSQTGITDFSFLSVTYNPSGDTISTSIAASDSINFYKLRDVKFASNGNIYLTGSTPSGASGRDIQTVALNSSLSVIWSSTYNSAASYNDEGKALTFDDNGNVYVTGYSQTAENGTDARLLKYNASGSLLWAKSYNGEGSGADTANAVLIDQAGLITIAGSTFNDANDDYFVQQYDTLGNLRYQKTWNSWSNKNDRATALAIDDAGAVVISGQSETDSTMNYTTVRYMKKQIHETESNSQSASAGGFIENRGQLLNTNAQSETEVLYYNQFMYPSTYYKTDTVSFVFSKIYADTSGNAMDSLQRVDMIFVNGTENTRYEPRGNNKSMTNFYYPHIENGRERVPTHSSLYKQNAWFNIDAEFASNQEGLLINFIVNPGGKVGDIKVKFDGQDSVFTDANGELFIQSILGEKSFDKAEAYTLYPNGQKSKLPWQPNYQISFGQMSFGNVGSYASNLPLVIEIKKKVRALQVIDGNIEWSTYFGGDGNDYILDMTTTISEGVVQGNQVLVCGMTSSNNFPYLNELYSENTGGWYDGFMASFNENDQLVWSTYYGGSGWDMLQTLSEQNSTNGEVFFAGKSDSEDYPLVEGGQNSFNQPGNHGDFDAVITSLRISDGSRTWSTYFGGEGFDEIVSITNDKADNYYFAGNTNSETTIETCQPGTNYEFPLCAQGMGYYQNVNLNSGLDGFQSGFISRFKSNNELTGSTFFGSNSNDKIYDIHFVDVSVDIPSYIFVVGQTDKVSDATYDCSGNWIDQHDAGFIDFPLCNVGSSYFEKSSGGFISRFKPNGFILNGSTNVKDVEFQTITSVNDIVYVGGYTDNPSTSLQCTPTLANASLPICYQSGEDGFTNGQIYLMKLSSTNFNLLWASLIPGTQYFKDAQPGYFFPNDSFFGEDYNNIYPKTLGLASSSNGNIFGVSLCSGNGSYTLQSSNLSSPMFFDDIYDGGAQNLATDVTIFSLNSNTNKFNWASYFGSDDNFGPGLWYPRNFDVSSAVAISSNDKLYISGYAGNHNLNFPFEDSSVPGNPSWFQNPGATFSYDFDGFIAKFDLAEVALSIPPVEENKVESDIILYPNPSNDRFVIDFKDNSVSGVTIISIDGKVVDRFILNKKTKLLSVNSSNWARGIYLVKIQSDLDIFKTLKFIKN